MFFCSSHQQMTLPNGWWFKYLSLSQATDHRPISWGNSNCHRPATSMKIPQSVESLFNTSHSVHQDYCNVLNCILPYSVLSDVWSIVWCQVKLSTQVIVLEGGHYIASVVGGVLYPVVSGWWLGDCLFISRSLKALDEILNTGSVMYTNPHLNLGSLKTISRLMANDDDCILILNGGGRMHVNRPGQIKLTCWIFVSVRGECPHQGINCT